MKHYLKRKMFLLSFCISLSLIFYQCQEDETTTIEQTEATELHTHTVSDKHLLDIDPEDVEAILNQVAAEGRGFIPKKEKGVSDDNRNVENPFGTVASDQVAGLEDLLGNKTYTFKIDAYNSQEGIFYNP